MTIFSELVASGQRPRKAYRAAYIAWRDEEVPCWDAIRHGLDRPYGSNALAALNDAAYFRRRLPNAVSPESRVWMRVHWKSAIDMARKMGSPLREIARKEAL